MAFIGKSPQAGNFIVLDSITTSATATYNLTRNSVAYFPASARNLIVSLNGVTQAPDTAYSVSGSTIVFASALTSVDSIDYILVLGDVLSIGTPADNTVGISQLNVSDGSNGQALTTDGSGTLSFTTVSTATPTLDAVTSAGATTTNAMTVGDLTCLSHVIMDTNTFYLNSQGNQLAFGTTSAAAGYDLTVKDPNGSTFNEQINWKFDVSGGSTVRGVNIEFVGFSTGSLGLTSGAASGTFLQNDTGSCGIIANANSTLGLYTSGSITVPDMVLSSTGNVGIGQASPDTKLHVNGTMMAGSGISVGGSDVLIARYSDGSDDQPNILGTSRSSSAWYMCYGLRPTTSTADTFTSSVDNSTWYRSAFRFGGDYAAFRSNGGAAVNTAVGTAVATNEYVRMDHMGISFNGDTAAANHLDDYEEGTWDCRPSTSNSSLSLFSGLTLTNYVGTYQKVGGWVHVQYYIEWSGTSSNTSAVYMLLPFTCASNKWSGTSIETSLMDYPTGTTYITVRPESNASYATFKACGTGVNRVDMTGNKMFANANGYTLGTFTYPVA